MSSINEVSFCFWVEDFGFKEFKINLIKWRVETSHYGSIKSDLTSRVYCRRSIYMEQGKLREYFNNFQFWMSCILIRLLHYSKSFLKLQGWILSLLILQELHVSFARYDICLLICKFSWFKFIAFLWSMLQV